MIQPVDKNKAWIAAIHEAVAGLDVVQARHVMKCAGRTCASDILAICEQKLGHEVRNVDDLIMGWNMRREERRLNGRWVRDGNIVTAVIGECSCPLVTAGLIRLHPVQCLCSQGMMETVFSKVSGSTVNVCLKRTIGRGDDACEFVVELQAGYEVMGK